MEDYYYRFDDDRSEGETVKVSLKRFKVVKHTPCGAWLWVWGERKFVLDRARKRLAYETKELALASFMARKERQMLILRKQLRLTIKAHQVGMDLERRMHDKQEVEGGSSDSVEAFSLFRQHEAR